MPQMKSRTAVINGLCDQQPKKTELNYFFVLCVSLHMLMLLYMYFWFRLISM